MEPNRSVRRTGMPILGLHRSEGSSVHPRGLQENPRSPIAPVSASLRVGSRHQWQSSGRVGVLKPELPDVEEAIEKFLKEAQTRNLAATTIKKRRELLEGKLLAYCKRKGYRHLRDLSVERLRDFRHGWKYSPLSAAKRLEYLRAFCRFCVEAGWMERNPAAALKPTKVSHRPTLPYSDDEVERLLKAARGMVGFGRYGPRIEPMILLLRYSGLRMQDAACLERQRLTGDKVFL